MLKSESITHQIENNIGIFQIGGEIVSTDLKEIDHYIKHYLNNESLQGGIINIQVKFVDSGLIGCLMEQLKQFQKQNLKSAICGLEGDISHFFNNIKLDQFAGVFSNPSEVLKAWDRPRQQKIQRRVLPRHEIDNTYYIVGPQKNWKLSHSFLITLLAIACLTFVLLIGTIIFQFFYFEQKAANLNDELDVSNQYSSTLTEEMLTTKKKYYDLKEITAEKNTRLSKIRLALKAETDQQWELVKNQTLYDKQMQELQEDIKKQEIELNQMKSLNLSSLETIQSLNKKIEDIKKKIATAKLETASVEPPPQEKVISVTLEKLQVSINQDKIVAQFNLRNKRRGIRSGFIMVTLINQKIASYQPIQFNREQAQTYSIRRFRPFIIEFPINEDPTLDAISVTVWDNQQNQLIQQVIPLPAS